MHRIQQPNQSRKQSVKRLIAVAFLLCFVVISISTISTMFFVVDNADHECTGIGCITCAKIENAKNLFNQISKVVAIISLAASVLLLSPFSLINQETLRIFSTALVCKKTKMNN